MLTKKILKIIPLLFFVFSLLWIFFIFNKGFFFHDNTWQLEEKDMIKWHPQEEIKQVFIANRDNLVQIEFLFCQSDENDRKNITVKILDEDCSNIIQEKTQTINMIEKEIAPFRFEKIKNSKEKKLCLSLSFTSEKNKNLEIYLYENPPKNSLFVLKPKSKTETMDKSLAMRPGYTNDTLGQNLTELNQRISQYKPWFFKHYFLYAISLGFIVLSVFLVVILIRL